MNLLESANIAPPRKPRDEQLNILRQVAITALRRWWMVVLPVGSVLAAIVAAAIFVTFEPAYHAVVMAQIKSYQPRIVFSDGGRGDSRLFVSTQRALMRSDLVLEQVISKPEIASMPELRNLSDPIKYLASKVSITSIGNSEVYEIGFEGPNPVNCAKLANAIWDSFYQFHDSMEIKRTDRVIELLQTEHERHAKGVEMLRREVRDLSEALTGKNPFSAAPVVDPHEESARSRLAFLQTELASNAVDQAMYRSRIAALEELVKRFPVTISDTAVAAAVAEREDILEVLATIAEKRKTLPDILKTATLREQDPLYQETLRQIREQTEMLKRTKEKIADEIRSNATSLQDADVQQLNAQLVTAQIMEKALNGQLHQAMSRSLRVTGDTLDLEFKRGELTRAEGVHEMIAERILKLQTESRAPGRIELWARAEPPTTPLEKMPFKKMVMVGGVAFCLPLLLAIGFEYRLRRVSDVDQWEANSLLPVLAEIASVSSHEALRSRSASGTLCSRDDDVGFFEEAIHGLRTRLMLTNSRRTMQVLAVTSAVSGEGKTSVASQLACSFARSSRKNVLLIDGDMRAPDLHKVFNVKRDPGLADVLQDEKPSAAIRTVLDDNFHLLSAGHPASNTHALVGTPAMENLIVQAREMYDIVILDTPPILAAHEALVLAKVADVVMLCIMRDHSRFDQVARAYDKLMGAGIKPIGAVFSGVPPRKYAYYYGKYYGKNGSSADEA